MRGICGAALAVVLLMAAACGPAGRSTASVSPSPTPSSAPSPVASPSPSPPPAVHAGAPAYVAVAVATLWRSPTSPRAVDGPALSNPVQVRRWLSALTAADQAGLIGRADSQVLLGDRVEVLAISGAWAQVVVPDQATPLDARGYPGWIPVAQLTGAVPPQTSLVATVTASTAWLTADGVLVMEVSFGTRLPVLGGSALTLRVAVAGAQALDVLKASVVVDVPEAAALPKTAAAVLTTMKQFLGVRYLWAGTSGFGYDCSGLMYLVFKAHGIVLPRDAQDQAGAGVPVASRSLQPGDLVFLAAGGSVHHVAVYAGGGMLLDSPDLGRGVQLVSMAVSPYSTEYAGARRVIA